MPSADHLPQAEPDRRVPRPRTSRSDDYLAQLTATQAAVLESASQRRLVRSLRRGLDGDLGPGELAERATAAVGTALRADRCAILFADPGGPDHCWTREGSLLPPAAYAGPTGLRRLLDLTARTRNRAETTVPGPGSGSRSVVATPLIARDELVGWLVVERTDRGPWSAHHLAVLDEHGPDLAVAVLLARTAAELRSLTAARAAPDR